jgi:hypothetical protein
MKYKEKGWIANQLAPKGLVQKEQIPVVGVKP